MIKKQEMIGLGLMSGSSLDGVDLAVCSFSCSYNEESRQVVSCNLKLMEQTCIPFSEDLKSRLVQGDQLSVAEFVKLDKDLGVFFGDSISNFLSDNPSLDIDFVASHGHTILHEPEGGYSCQIGSISHIAKGSGLLTIGDFRNMDMAFGGQGAPMAPLIDKYIFSDVDMFLNIGGIANVSYNFEGKVWGYDLAPANQFFNRLAAQLGFTYDDGGSIASSGSINYDLLARLEKTTFFTRQAPKSLDNIDIRDNIWPLIEADPSSVQDKLATCVHLIVRQFEKSLIHFKSSSPSKQQINLLISGGGAKNDFLVQQLLNLSSEEYVLNQFKISESVSDMKEAMLMVLAGGLRLLKLPNVFASVTGAEKDTIGGGIFYPK
jgi:anhydro-N-acetylmuramic acid kinase